MFGNCSYGGAWETILTAIVHDGTVVVNRFCFTRVHPKLSILLNDTTFKNVIPPSRNYS